VLDVSRKELWHFCSRICFHGLQATQSSFHADNFDVLVNKQQIENALKPYWTYQRSLTKIPNFKKEHQPKRQYKKFSAVLAFEERASCLNSNFFFSFIEPVHAKCFNLWNHQVQFQTQVFTFLNFVFQAFRKENPKPDLVRN
jgi:hypothetical protein